jgi:hypothetical protein
VNVWEVENAESATVIREQAGWSVQFQFTEDDDGTDDIHLTTPAQIDEELIEAGIEADDDAQVYAYARARLIDVYGEYFSLSLEDVRDEDESADF